ncbi:unnamed protein product [Notodromas monacha]|uniref:Uncharacterized protein n=1 Tax=Notodromas monacha TaxID=399045 RepID=A0A7R9BNM8_9CRUS|nr:unnamed protein product [Notodromas monacha]CAG0917319.1 unnamed protein product [Notodromas monacha]
MRAFFEKPRKLGVLPRMVKIQHQQLEQLQHQQNGSSPAAAGTTTSSASNRSNLKMSISSSSLNDSVSSSSSSSSSTSSSEPKPGLGMSSECSEDQLSTSDDASASSDEDDPTGSRQVDNNKTTPVVVCYKGPYIEQEEEREVLCNINNAFLTKKKLHQARHMLQVLQVAHRGLLANKNELELRKEQEDQDQDQWAADFQKSQNNVEEILQMIEKTEAIVDHYTRKYKDFVDSGETRGLDDLFE